MASKTTQITLITLQFGILLLQTGSVALQLRSAVPGLLVALLWLACMALGLGDQHRFARFATPRLRRVSRSSHC